MVADPDTTAAELTAVAETRQTFAPGLVVYGTHQATFRYRNWRGDTAQRRIGVMSIWFGSTEWHPEPQWLMHAIDLEKMETRDFAMKDMADVVYT